MKKDAIIDLIENDLNEMRRLVETFRDPERIANAFIELLSQKHESLGKEISLLNYWASDNIGNLGKSELVAEVKKRQPSPVEDTPKPTCQKAQKGESIKPEERGEEVVAPINDREEFPHEQKLAPSPKHRDDVPDYFSDELESMPDPLEGTSSYCGAEEAKTFDTQVSPSVQFNELPKDTQDLDIQPKEYESRIEPAADTSIDEEEIRPHHKACAMDIANYGTPVDDLIKAIGINDRFLYQRELFKGNKLAFDAAVETINAATSYNQAYQYLRQSFGWDETDPTVEAFLKAVHRRFL